MSFATDFCSNGTIFDIVAYSGPFSEDLARCCFRQLCAAVNHMHLKGFAHRDIKPENIMLDEDFNIKLIDFGMTDSIDGDHSWKGTRAYMSPFALLGEVTDITKDDVYTCGVMLFIMVNGTPPCEEATSTDHYYKYIYYNFINKFWKKHI